MVEISWWALGLLLLGSVMAGAVIGFIGIALCTVASEADDRTEREWRASHGDETV